MCLAQELASRLTGKPNVLSLQKFAELRAPGWVCDPDAAGARNRVRLRHHAQGGDCGNAELVSAAALAVKNYTFVDYATQAYIALVGLLILFFHNDTVPNWPGCWRPCRRPGGGPFAHRGPCAARVWQPLDFLRHFYPVLLYTAFFIETGSLNRMFFSEYLDPVVAQWEQQIFGCQPSVLFMQKLPWLAVSELFYASYFSYYIMIAGVGIALFLRSRQQFFHYVSVVSFLFYVCYLDLHLPAGDRVPGVLSPGGWLCAAGGCSTTGRNRRLSRGRSGGGVLPDHEVGLSRL